MTPDEQPQPVALGGPASMDEWARIARALRIHGLKIVDTHPPTSAASQPDAVRVTEKQINDMTIVLMDNWYMDRHSWRAGSGANERIERMRSALVKAIQAVLNPPAESAAHGDVPNATPTSGGVE